MTETQGKNYQREKTGDILIFRTPNFSAERGSVLHSGIFNREFSSALSSLAVAGLAYMAAVINLRRGLLPHVIFLLVFVPGFLFLRRFVFKEKLLEVHFDRHTGKTELFIAGITRRKKDSFPISAINNVLIGQKKTAVVNPDGVEFVEKISSQHGMVIPGFGEEKIFFLLTLTLTDGTDRLIFADSNMRDVMEAHAEIKEFLELA